MPSLETATGLHSLPAATAQGSALVDLAACGLRACSVLRPQVRLLRFRVAGRMSIIWPTVTVGTRTRDGHDARATRRRSRRSSSAGDADPARCRPARALTGDHRPLVPLTGRRMDRRGQSRHARHEKADVLASAGVNRVSLGAQSFQPDLLARPRAQPCPGRGRTGGRTGPAAIRPLVARPDLRRARLDPRRLARPTSTAALHSGRRTSRATVWSTRREPTSGNNGRPAWSCRSTRRPSDACTRSTIERLAAAGLAMYEISN